MSKYTTIGCEFGWLDKAAAREERFEYVIVYNADDIPEKKLRKSVSQWVEKLLQQSTPNIYCSKTYFIGALDTLDFAIFIRTRLEFLGDFMLLDYLTNEAKLYRRDGTTEDLLIIEML